MQRNKELDSLRGLAAVSVLLYHALATNSASLTAGISLASVEGLAANLLVYTPLHVVWLGAESVWLFFILSGFVLTRSASRDGFSWQSYFPSRTVRLYLPVLFAVALAWILYSVGSLLSDTPADLNYGPAWILRDITLVGGTSTLLGVLWSLQWEVIFSLALPLYLWLLRRHLRISAVVAGILCIGGFYFNLPAASFLPMFFVGGMLAHRWDWIAARFRFLASGTWRGNVAGVVLLIAAVCGLTSFYLAGRWLASLGFHAPTATVLIVLASICLLIILSMLWAPLRSVLHFRVFVFLGTMSFSLYLVHLPIVVILANLLPTGPLTAALSVLFSLLLGWLFYLVVERPSHRLARRISVEERLLVESLPRP